MPLFFLQHLYSIREIVKLKDQYFQYINSRHCSECFTCINLLFKVTSSVRLGVSKPFLARAGQQMLQTLRTCLKYSRCHRSMTAIIDNAYRDEHCCVLIKLYSQSSRQATVCQCLFYTNKCQSLFSKISFRMTYSELRTQSLPRPQRLLQLMVGQIISLCLCPSISY